VAETFGQGRRIDSPEDARELRAACVEHNGRVEYSNRDYTHVGPDHPDFESTGGTGIYYRFVVGSPYAHIEGDPIRYRFTDGSAIVQHGDAWGVEGREPFTLRE
jgi:hypothetical protein